jgi:hypothetical protein
MRITDFRIT